MYTVTPLRTIFLRFALAYLLLGLIIALGYQDIAMKKEHVRAEAELAATKQEYASTSQQLLANIDSLNLLLATTTIARDNLEQNLRDEQGIIELMQQQIESVSGAVSTLERLSNTDRELLEKYSRVYFLNENYIPETLSPVPPQYVYAPDKEKLFSGEALPLLLQLLDDARAEGIDLLVISAYRSFGTQGLLKSAYTMTYGSNTANKFSADQGYSEHQLGTTVDFTTTALGAQFTNLQKVKAYQWLLDNAYRYGFILSYPKTNTYYTFEPWHWRFVGKSLARDLYDVHKNFYDLTQREIDTYLISLFDQ
jgi:D-alanyl-D-alanine carboxypeptidase